MGLATEHDLASIFAHDPTITDVYRFGGCALCTQIYPIIDAEAPHRLLPVTLCHSDHALEADNEHVGARKVGEEGNDNPVFTLSLAVPCSVCHTL